MHWQERTLRQQRKKLVAPKPHLKKPKYRHVSPRATMTRVKKVEPPSPEKKASRGHEEKPTRYEILVPMLGIDEWELWSFLETRFGEDNFGIVVSQMPARIVNTKSVLTLRLAKTPEPRDIDTCASESGGGVTKLHVLICLIMFYYVLSCFIMLKCFFLEGPGWEVEGKFVEDGMVAKAGETVRVLQR
ncbi:hypothetical protein B0T25DRAFT_551098 [Lasiosphaeria hispida]|uniref:Uncharacterized protein n=1 Tax=Lasiosphaeria hispida TaxID=260671 RepID=A0AAJ0HAP6_9PEZI|nr:hypothetical protein B0T25DRAFT_551098 [Lasiosphaeria hispida]